MNSMNTTLATENQPISYDITKFAHHMVLLARTKGHVEKVFNGVELKILPGADTTADDLVQYYYNVLSTRAPNPNTVQNRKYSFS